MMDVCITCIKAATSIYKIQVNVLLLHWTQFQFFKNSWNFFVPSSPNMRNLTTWPEMNSIAFPSHIHHVIPSMADTKVNLGAISLKLSSSFFSTKYGNLEANLPPKSFSETATRLFIGLALSPRLL